MSERGRFKNWNKDRGFGFIACDNPNVGDVFCHATAFEGMLPYDTEVDTRTLCEFELRPSQRHPGKMCAARVCLLDD